MDKNRVKRNLILGILFFLPVVFLLFLYPAKHHYNTLDIVNKNVLDFQKFSSDSDTDILLKDHITVLGFLGKHPMEGVTAASNIKELVYDKFRGFKNFQVVMVVSNNTDDEVEQIKKEIHSYEDLKYWHFAYMDDASIRAIYGSLKTIDTLDADLHTNHIFIIDKDLSQRGRFDDRSDNELAGKKAIHDLTSYDAIEVAVLKNKMSEDVRVLFTEYRQKRKGNFDSSTRRINDLKGNDEKEN